MQHIQFNQEKLKLNEKLQKENEIRTNRMKEYKRKQILMSHLIINEKNAKNKKNLMLYNSYLRKSAIDKNDAKNKVYKLLEELTKIDPRKTNERDLLIKKLNELNDKFDLKINLNIPKKSDSVCSQ